MERLTSRENALIKGKQERYQAMADRAMAAMESYRKAREER